jgi:cyclic beta-1,2-glucan synthetase
MYRAGVEGILGIRREGAFLVIDPCIPATWPGFEATVKVGSTQYDIRVETPLHCRRDISHALLDGSRLDCAEGRVRVALDGETHTLLIGVEQELTQI